MKDHRAPSDPVADITNRIGPAEWETARQTSIGGAGVSTAFVLLLAQIGVGSGLLLTSLYSASVAIPIWLALWQVGHAYALRPEAKHHLTASGAFLGSGLFLLGGAASYTSLLTLILHFSRGAGLTFAVVSVVTVILVFRHHTVVARHRGGG